MVVFLPRLFAVSDGTLYYISLPWKRWCYLLSLFSPPLGWVAKIVTCLKSFLCRYLSGSLVYNWYWSIVLLFGYYSLGQDYNVGLQLPYKQLVGLGFATHKFTFLKLLTPTFIPVLNPYSCTLMQRPQQSYKVHNKEVCPPVKELHGNKQNQRICSQRQIVQVSLCWTSYAWGCIFLHACGWADQDIPNRTQIWGHFTQAKILVELDLPYRKCLDFFQFSFKRNQNTL